MLRLESQRTFFVLLDWEEEVELCAEVGCTRNVKRGKKKGRRSRVWVLVVWESQGIWAWECFVSKLGEVEEAGGRSVGGWNQSLNQSLH